MNLDEVLNYRRSVRVYDKEKEIDIEKVKHCLELATLAPNSSDMQLWEFYHITQPVYRTIPPYISCLEIKNEFRPLPIQVTTCDENNNLRSCGSCFLIKTSS